MRKNYKTIPQLLEQAIIIADADDKFASEIWHLDEDLRKELDDAFAKLVERSSSVKNIRIEKMAATQKYRAMRKKMLHSLTRLKEFIRVVADKKMARDMFHTLGIEKKYPLKTNDLLEIIVNSVLPNLNKWDGTSQEIAPEIKNDIIARANDFEKYYRRNLEIQALSTTATQDQNIARKLLENTLVKIRNWLYLKLPQGKYDAHLDEYGFNIWKKPPKHRKKSK